MGSPQGFQSHGDVATGALNEDVVVAKRRSLLATPEALSESLYRYFADPVHGAFSLNVLADIFVKVIFFVGTALWICRAKRKEQISEALERREQLDILRAQNTDLRTLVEWMRSQSVGTATVLQADSSSVAQSTSSAAPPDPAGGTSEQANLGSLSGTTPVTQGVNARFSPASRPVANKPDTVAATSSVPVPTKLVQGDHEQKGPFEQLRRRNGFNLNRSRSLNLTSTFSCASTTSSGEDVPKEHHVVDIQVQFTFPEDLPSKSPSMSPQERGNADKFKDTVLKKLGVSIGQDVASSRVMQARVPVTEESLSALRDLAVEGMKLDRGFTLQIGESFLYYCNGNPEEPILLSLRDVEVPTILQVEYSAGLLTITGRYLEGAEIRAATSEGYMIFESIKQDPINKLPLEESIGVWRCTDLLPPVKLDRIQIFASKRVHKEGRTVTVRSEISSIRNTTVRTVIYKWMPTIFILNILASQSLTVLRLFINLMTDPLHHSWLFYSTFTLALYIIQLLSPSLEENIKDFMERLKLAISSFHVFPEPLDSPGFIMRNGFCFQRGAKYFVNSNSMVGGNDLQEVDKQKELSNSLEKPINEGVNNDENLETKRDWKWPCWISKNKEKLERFDFDSNIEKSNDESSPFEVIYNDQIQNYKNFGKVLTSKCIPKDIVVKLHSKYLQKVVKDWLPKKLKQFEKYGEIKAKFLLILYINGKLNKKDCHLESNIPSTSNSISESNNLHMFHLKRFLDKEYEDIIKEYNRMMEAGVISWDMLWTLIVPEIDVIYYCQISKEELCGKVCMAYYYMSSYNIHDCLEIELEVYDYDCNSFRERRIQRKMLVFNDEVKIINLDIFPLKHKPNPHEMEEYFFKRGNFFSDLVLKYKHQYMHYHGFMYDYDSDDKRKLAKEEVRNFKASIEGRVMIDQGWFAKMKPKWKMGTAQASGLLRVNESSERNEMRIKAMANGFDSKLKYSPAIVYGYSFSLRKWGCFNIEGFSKIHFTSTAFDKLVMNEENKCILLTLTKYYIKHPNHSNDVRIHVDLLPNKGEGCIIVLHGPPGTGKTLTVEALAERLECPLWQLNISKLTASTKQLENKMLKKFEVAKSWGAILVLDEADVYLSSRKYSPLSSNNTQNNAMTGVFLRVLEYYKGILFLTTNEMNHIEPAIFSRMSLFIKYEDFNTEERKKIWSNFLEEIKVFHLSDKFWKKVLFAPFNGRVIRNIIQNSQILLQCEDFTNKNVEECLLKAFDAMAIPSTMRFLDVQPQEPLPSSTEGIIDGTQSILSAPTFSSLSDLSQMEARE